MDFESITNTHRQNFNMKQRFGNYVGKLHVGDGFGELAIISEKDKRTASIVADEELHLLTVDKTNYLRVLKAHREKEMRGVVTFLKTVPIMAMMSEQDIYHLAEVMVSRRYLSDEVVLAQGEARGGLLQHWCVWEVRRSLTIGVQSQPVFWSTRSPHRRRRACSSSARASARW